MGSVRREVYEVGSVRREVYEVGSVRREVYVSQEKNEMRDNYIFLFGLKSAFHSYLTCTLCISYVGL